MSPLAVDLFCGKGGWSNGLLAAGWDVCGFDIATDVTRGYPGHLCIQDVATISGYPMRGNVSLIVASPPCQEFSYMAMPFSRGKRIAAALRGECEFPEGYKGSRTIPELTTLFHHCFRIAREAQCPVIVENVKGAQPWVGRASWHHGSFYLWGDVPALMIRPVHQRMKTAIHSQQGREKNGGTSAHWTNPAEHPAVSIKQHGSGAEWFDKGICNLPSGSRRRKEASAQIAMIPFDLARYVGQVFSEAQ